MAEVIRQLGISEVTFYHWRKECGGMSGNWLSQRRQLEKENERLRRPVADLTLDRQILTELDLGFNPLEDLRPLAALPRLEPLGPNGMAADL